MRKLNNVDSMCAMVLVSAHHRTGGFEQVNVTSCCRCAPLGLDPSLFLGFGFGGHFLASRILCGSTYKGSIKGKGHPENGDTKNINIAPT